MKSIYRQRGMSLWGMAALFVILSFSILIVLKLFPVYYQQFKLAKVMKNIKEEFNSSSSSEAIRSRIAEKFSIDDIDMLSYKDIMIERTSTGFRVAADVDVKKNLFGNLSLLVSINESVHIGGN